MKTMKTTITGHKMIDNFWAAKIAGATIGSSIAVVFRPGGDTWLKLVQRFVIGAILGIIFSKTAMDYLGWEQTFENWLSAATGTGLTAYLILQLLFSEKTAKAIRDKLPKSG